MTQGAAQQSLDADVVRRPEYEQLIDNLNREFSGLTKQQEQILSRLDQVLNGRIEEANQMGRLQEQVRRLGEDVGRQSSTIQAMQIEANRSQIAPRDAALKAAMELGKLLIAGIIGYFMSGHHP